MFCIIQFLNLNLGTLKLQGNEKSGKYEIIEIIDV